MEKVTVNAELLFVLNSKRDWVNNVPQILPDKTRSSEQWLWVDSNGDVFEIGKDFEAAEKKATYPCKVYRLRSVSSTTEEPEIQNEEPEKKEKTITIGYDIDPYEAYSKIKGLLDEFGVKYEESGEEIVKIKYRK
jgi:hypothetical protein